jgi:uridine kinase
MFADVGEATNFALSYSDLCKSFVAELLHLRQIGTNPMVWALAGRSRSGKSSIAHALLRVMQETGRRVLIVDLDQWIVPASERGFDETAETRNRVACYPDIVARLCRGETVSSPGYDPLFRGAGSLAQYDPAGVFAVILVGIFANHSSIRKMIDFACFVDCPEHVLHSRFIEYYRWKGLDANAIAKLWKKRRQDEWPAIDSQRSDADLILNQGGLS